MSAEYFVRIPDVIRRCFALSGVYDICGFMSGMYDDNTYLATIWRIFPIRGFSGSWRMRHSYRHRQRPVGEQRAVVSAFKDFGGKKGIRHLLHDWGPQGGHDWPFWKHQMWEYITRLF